MSVENMSVKNTSVKNMSVKNTFVKNTFVKNTSVENTSVENTSVENTSVENMSVELRILWPSYQIILCKLSYSFVTFEASYLQGFAKKNINHFSASHVS